MKNQIRRIFQDFLLAYCNGSIKPFQRFLVDLWIRYDSRAQEELAALKQLSLAVNNQAEQQPEPRVFLQIQERTRRHQDLSPAIASQRKWAYLLSAFFGLGVIIFLAFRLLPPGVSLLWSIESGQPASFRIYRAPVGERETGPSPEFRLIQEIPADNTDLEYSYLDVIPLPFQSYIYRVDVINSGGDIADSRTVIGDGLSALTGQLTLLMVIVFSGLLIWSMARSGYFNGEYLRLSQLI